MIDANGNDDGQGLIASPSQSSTPAQTATQTTTPQSTDLASHSTQVNENSLVSNQLTGLLDSDSPYLQQAETRGLQQANQRGLLSSSLAVGAVEGARISAALPIAQQDASLYGQADLQDSAFEQQGHLNTQQGNINANLQQDQFQNNQQLNQEQFTSQSQLQAENAIQNSQNQLQATIANIQTDPNLSETQKNDAINTATNLHNAIVAINTRAAELSSSSFIYSGNASQTQVTSPVPAAPAPSTQSTAPITITQNWTPNDD